MNTSLNIDKNFHDEVKSTAVKFSKPGSAIIKDLLVLTINNVNCNHYRGKLTEYQDHQSCGWETLYYIVDENEVEMLGIARQKYKVSISKLAFIGF
ncbi:MAG: hypothetical protein JW982_13180 [Spirochaetes bacterium]|nr:hypothetical protein [Spirochaetota bacterium]